MNFKRTFLTIVAAAALAAVGMYPVILTDWFSQTFEGLADGTAFTGQQGAAGGSWKTIPTGVATVMTVNGRKCISVDTTFCTNAIQFVATNMQANVARIDFAVSSEPTPWLPAVLDGDKAALSFASDDNGMMTFVGYTSDGWVKLSCQGLIQRKSEWIDCRAEFEYVSDTEAYVTYYACCGGRDHQPLANAAGTTRFPIDAASSVQSLAFCGTGAVGDFKGVRVEEDATRVYKWTGPTGEDRRWENAKNWADYQEKNHVPGNGDLAQLPKNKSIIYGKYTIMAMAESDFSIASNECFRIVSGDIAISCTDETDNDYTSLGTVYAETGATLWASGRYYSIEMAAGSTLELDATAELEIVGKPFFLDGVNLKLNVSSVSEGKAIVSAPYGSGGVPASLSCPSGWSVAWHGQLDGITKLWLADQNPLIDVAVWKDGAWGNLVDDSNWSLAPGADVAARMGNGQAHVNRNDVFKFGKWFDIGHVGSGEVDMSGGSVLGSADSSVIVGSEGGNGLLDIVGGTVRSFDYLWNYALTIGSGTNSTGKVRVRGGAVDAVDGSVSVGADSTSKMEIERGRVAVGDSLGVGYAGTLDVLGGLLTVSNSLYIGRATRGEVYDVRMTVTHGAVSNLAAGAIWVGSYGGVGSKAILDLTGGEVYATNRFVCGGYRSARVDVSGGKLVAPEICIGYDLIDMGDVAAFNLVSGRVETAGFTSGTNGVREVTLAGGELVATAANDDFFADIGSVRIEGDVVLSNASDIAIRSVLTGPGGFVKAGAGTNTIAGYAAWAGKTVVSEGVLDMAGGMVLGELSISPGASVAHAKYDEIDELLPFMTVEKWTSGTASVRPYVCVDFQMAADGVTLAEALDSDGERKGSLKSVADVTTGARAFFGWSVLGWTELRLQDGSAVEDDKTYDLRMIFDLRKGSKPYVMYYAKCGDAYERMVSADGLAAFPVAGTALDVKTFMLAGESIDGLQLYVAAGKSLYWIGPDGGEWNDGQNWSHDPDGEQADAYPQAGSLAYVERPANISIGAAAKTALLMVNDNVRIAGAMALSVSSAVSGVGQLTLAGSTLQAAGINVPVDVPVVVEENTSNRILSTPPSCTFVLNGSLRGTGEIALTALNRRPMGGTVLAGDNAAFGGVVKIYPYWKSATDHQQLDMPSIAVPEASSENAQWEINIEHDYPKTMRPGMDFFGTANATYRFGSLKANFYRADDYDAYWAKDGVTLEVGTLDQDSYAIGACVAKDGTIDWVAPTATFRNGVAGLSALRLSGGGKLVVEDESALPSDAITFADKGGELFCDVNADLSVLITNSAAPVVFNDGGTPCEWSGAPGPSNVGGFVKRGSGTLEWYAAPTFRIDVTVEEGVLIVPFGTQLGKVSVSPGAAIVVVCSNAVESALVFSADESDNRLQDPELRFLDVPESYELTFTYGKGNAVVVANGGSQFDWTDEVGNQLWATPGNWRVGTTVPARSPMNLDGVWYGMGSSVTCLDSPAAAMSLTGFGDLAFTGSYALNVLLKFTVDGVLDLCPNPMSADSSGADYYGAGTNVLGVSSVASFSACSVRGEGCVSVGDKELVVSPAGGTADRFVGTLHAGDFVKRGAGTFVFIGDGAFSGKVAVEQGTLRLGDYRDIDGIRMDFDASDEASLELDDDGVSRWASQVGTNAFAYAGGQRAVLTTDYFNGRPAVMMRPVASSEAAFSRYDLVPANSPGDASKSLFMVYVPVGSAGGYGYSQSGDSTRSLYRDVGVDDGPWYCPKAGFDTVGIFSGVSYGSATVRAGVPALTFWSDTALQDEQGVVESLGTAGENVGFRGAIGEVVAFTNTLTHVERDVTTRLLMNKWGVSGADEFAPIHTSTPVTMGAGATLDLGGKDVTVGSFTGAGIVTNGVLVTADGKVTQSGGMLSIPAVEGTTYVASSAGHKLIIRDAPGVTVRIVIPKGWFSAGNTGRRTIFCESERIEWDVWNDTVRPVDEGDGSWSISGGGFAIRLR